MNRGILFQQAANYLHRSDLVDTFTAAVPIVEARLNRELRLAAQIVSRADTLPPNTHTFTVDGILEVLSLSVGQRLLDYAPPAEILERSVSLRNTGPTAYYTISGLDELTLYPATGDGPTPYSLQYYGRITPLVDDESYNNLLTTNPDIYLYGLLLETAINIQQPPDVVQTFEREFGNRLQSVINDDNNSRAGVAARTLFTGGFPMERNR